MNMRTHCCRFTAPRIAAAGAALLVAACQLGPTYIEPPAVAVGNAWSVPVPEGQDAARLAEWWRSLDDPTLVRLIDTALAQNLQLKQAVARIAEARAWVAASSARSMPTLTAGAGLAALHQGTNGPLPAVGGQNKDIYFAGFDATWEIDIFGGVQRSVQAAEARMQATAEDATAVRISIAAEVARTYIALRGAQHELAARRAGVDTLKRALATATRRFEAGDIAAAEVDAARTRLDAAAASLPPIEARIRGAALALGTLLGTVPEAELALVDQTAPMVALVELPVGQRADLLRRRPDIRAAERRLAGSYADVGSAMAEMFPKLSITALGGFVALTPSTLINSNSLNGVAAPLISWRIFDGGRVKAEIQGAEARRDTAVLAYEGAVISALGDAERALSEYRHSREALERQGIALASTRRDYANAERRYASGDIGLPERLDAERQVHVAEENVAVAQALAAINQIALYKSLGGGWSGEETVAEGVRR